VGEGAGFGVVGGGFEGVRFGSGVRARDGDGGGDGGRDSGALSSAALMGRARGGS
jgi:hypothetical protein